MASNPFNALMNPADVGNAFSSAFDMGMQRAQEKETRTALQGYMKDPNEQNALAVGAHNPMLGMRLQDREVQRQQQMAQQQQEARAAQLRQAAANGDPAARAELAGIDFQAWSTLDTKAKADIADRVEYIGQAALAVSQLPPEQQAQAWDQYVMQGAQRFPDLAQYQGKFSPQALQAALAQSGQVKEFLDLERPRYQVVPQGGTLVDTANPQAVQQFAQGGGMPSVSDAQGYDALPPGTQYTDPQGNVRVKPGGAGGNVSGNFPG